jgi:2'-5' RNA ligase
VGYSIELSFDANSEARLRALWAALAEQTGVSTLRVFGGRPHVSLAVFPDVKDTEMVREIIAACARVTDRFTLNLSAAAAFPTKEGIVFVAPAPCRTLLEIHRSIHARLADAGEMSNPHYLPGQWMPHCTVTAGIEDSQVAAALEAVRASDVFGPVEVRRIALMEFPPAREVAAFALIG